MSTRSVIQAAFAGVRSPYETHRPVLREAVLRVPAGIILELGAGEGSTRALHEVSQATNRAIITLEHDRTWTERFASLRSKNHAIVHVASWTDLDNPILQALPYGIAFVDHAPADRRIVDIQWLARRAQVVVVHDTESKDYGYDKIFGLFRHSVTYKGHVPWTSVFSNFVDVSGWRFV